VFSALVGLESAGRAEDLTALADVCLYSCRRAQGGGLIAHRVCKENAIDACFPNILTEHLVASRLRIIGKGRQIRRKTGPLARRLRCMFLQTVAARAFMPRRAWSTPGGPSKPTIHLHRHTSGAAVMEVCPQGVRHRQGVKRRRRGRKPRCGRGQKAFKIGRGRKRRRRGGLQASQDASPVLAVWRARACARPVGLNSARGAAKGLPLQSNARRPRGLTGRPTRRRARAECQRLCTDQHEFPN